jgi:hypothetical protein
VISGKGDAGVKGDAEGGDDLDNNLFKKKRYKKTKAKSG